MPKRPAPDSPTRPRRRAVVNRHLHRYTNAELRHWRTLSAGEQREVAGQEDAAAATGLHDDAPLRYRILARGFDPAVTRRMLGYAEGLADDDAKRREYLEVALSVPLGRYAAPFKGANPRKALQRLRASLDGHVYGHADAKSALMRVVAQWLKHPEARGLSVLLCGEKGCGKTHFADGVARALNMPYTYVALGGGSDGGGGALLGHSFCYVGSHVGAIAQALIRHQSMAQVFLFDEVDKAASAAVAGALVHLTDETTNTRFRDRYLGDVDLDMSRSLLLFTANDASLVSPVLLDRMVRIDVPGYSAADKVEIARRHIVPAALKEFGLLAPDPAADALASDAFVRSAVAATADEKGVRDLKRAIKAVCAEVNVRRTLGDLRTGADDLHAVLKKETAGRQPPCLGMMYT